MLNKVYQYGNNMVLTDNSDEGVEFILQKANEKYGMDKNLIE